MGIINQDGNVVPPHKFHDQFTIIAIPGPAGINYALQCIRIFFRNDDGDPLPSPKAVPLSEAEGAGAIHNFLAIRMQNLIAENDRLTLKVPEPKGPLMQEIKG